MADSVWGAGRRLDKCLSSAPYQFEFFQAVRLLRIAEAEREQPRALADALRFRTHTSMSFPASPVVAVAPAHDDAPARMAVAFLGLIGPSRTLPDTYTELSLRQLAFGDDSFAAFFDLFHHRLLVLYYDAWQKHQFAVRQEQAGAGRDAITGYLLDMIGMGTVGLEGRLPFPDEALLRYAGLLAQRPHSAECLRSLLHDWFRLPVRIQQFCGRWHTLDYDDLCALGSIDENSRLGEGAIAGDAVWNLQSSVRVVLGPLSADDFFRFLPDGARFEEITALVRWFLGPELHFELQPVLAKGITPQWTALGRVSPDGGGRCARLGWSNWLTSESFPTDADAAMFAEDEAYGLGAIA